jgi:lysophospholipase L1-like esterase
VAAVVLLAVTLVVSASAAAPPRTLYVNGDSLAVGTGPYLHTYLRSWRITQTADISRHAPEGAAMIRTEHPSASVLLVQLGTNDDPSQVSSFRRAVHQVLAAAGPGHCVVWPNILRPPVEGVSYDGYNRVLADTAARNSGLRVVDWVSLAQANPAWLAGDGVHVSAVGYEARARLLAGEVKRCYREIVVPASRD